jgi:hypothetical protein
MMTAAADWMMTAVADWMMTGWLSMIHPRHEVAQLATGGLRTLPGGLHQLQSVESCCCCCLVWSAAWCVVQACHITSMMSNAGSCWAALEQSKASIWSKIERQAIARGKQLISFVGGLCEGFQCGGGGSLQDPAWHL